VKRHPEENEPAEQTEDEAGEDNEQSGRGSLAALVVVALLITWRIVVVFPELAYTVVGVLGTVGCQKIQAWREGRHGDDQTSNAKVEQPDVGEALRRLVGDDNGVLLTRLRDDLKLPDTKVVKRLLDADGITWKGVRTSRGNGPGVHVKDIPPAPSPVAEAHGDGCCCRSGDNTNSDNGPEGDGEKGVRVDRTDTGFTVHDLVETFFNEASKNRRPAGPREGTASD
jgi:hypothetical protein